MLLQMEKNILKYILILICLNKSLCCPSKSSQPSIPPLDPDPTCNQKSAGYFEITKGGLVKVGDDVNLTLCVSEKDAQRDCRFSSTHQETCFYLEENKAV